MQFDMIQCSLTVTKTLINTGDSVDKSKTVSDKQPGPRCRQPEPGYYEKQKDEETININTRLQSAERSRTKNRIERRRNRAKNREIRMSNDEY